MKGFIFVPSAFAVKQTLTRTVSLPVDFSATSFAPVELMVVLPIMSDQTAVRPLLL